MAHVKMNLIICLTRGKIEAFAAPNYFKMLTIIRRMGIKYIYEWAKMKQIRRISLCCDRWQWKSVETDSVTTDDLSAHFKENSGDFFVVESKNGSLYVKYVRRIVACSLETLIVGELKCIESMNFNVVSIFFFLSKRNINEMKPVSNSEVSR